MSREKFNHLEQEFNKFKQAFTDKSDQAEKLLPSIIEAFAALGYTRNRLASTLDIDTLTIDRWRTGNTGMKDHSFLALSELVEDVIQGLPQLPVRVSDAGFITREYLFVMRQPLAKWIWYISEERFLLSRSRTLREEVRNLFIAEEQDKYAERLNLQDPIIPRMIYVFPEHSETLFSLEDWFRSLDIFERNEPGKLRGTILGIKVTDTSSIPWFFPGLRSVILEVDGNLEGYARLRIPRVNEETVLEAMGVEEPEDAQRPWLRMHRDVTERCFARLEELYLRKVLNECEKQEERNEPFFKAILEV